MNRLEIISVPLADIKPFEKNAKLHPKEQVEQIKRSIADFGMNDPIAIDENNVVIEGHGRLLALKEMDTAEVPCIRLTHLSEGQKRAYILAHNKLTLNSGFDTDLLIGELDFLKDAGFDTSLTGFSIDELEKMFADNDKTEPHDDDFNIDAAVSEPPFAQTGDLWSLGRHRLLVGDSTSPNDVNRLMGGINANLLLTDAPYGVNYEGKAGKIANDNLNDEDFYKFLYAVFANAEAVLDNEASAYVFHSDTRGEIFRRAFREARFKLSGVCQWVKPSLVLGRSPYQWQNEPCLFGWKAKGKHKWFAGRAETTIWNFDKPKKNDIHCTMKPIPLLAYPIKNSTSPNAVVLDLFSGSFSTGIACEQTGRICYAAEIDVKYASASIKRFREHSPGADITVERGGKILTYEEVIGNG